MKITTVKWCRLENIDATATLKEHGFIEVEKNRPYTGESYSGNTSLCKRIYVAEDEGVALPWDEIDFSATEPSKGACKKCLKAFEKINTDSPVGIPKNTNYL